MSRRATQEQLAYREKAFRVRELEAVTRVSAELDAAHRLKANQTAARLGHLMVRALAEAGL